VCRTDAFVGFGAERIVLTLCLLPRDREVRTSDNKTFGYLKVLKINFQVPVQLEKTKYFCCCCCKSGPLTYVAYLPGKGYVPGQDIPITVEIENGSNVKVREVTCELLKVSVSLSLFIYIF
jgi:hypothetical protein